MEESFSNYEGIVDTPTENNSGVIPALQSVVATVNLNCKLYLKNIVLRARGADYNPKRFAAVIMRIREPKSSALIFSPGKVVVTGVKSEKQSKLAAQRYSKIINGLGFNADFKVSSFRILFHSVILNSV